MRIYDIILAIQIIAVQSASEIAVPVDNESLRNTAGNIVEKCFTSSQRWSMLLIISRTSSLGIAKVIHQISKTSSLIVSLDAVEDTEFLYARKNSDHVNTTVASQDLQPTAVLITARSQKQLESSLDFFRNNNQHLWNPRSSVLIVLEGRCNVTKCNNMFKAVWSYWILDAIILCSKNDPNVQNQSETELYAFNPYSVDRSPEWKLIINETVRVSIYSGNSTHSWYVLKQTFTEINPGDCRNIFFDKTFNLEGYIVPLSASEPKFATDGKKQVEVTKSYDKDLLVMNTVSEKFHSLITMITSEDTAISEQSATVNDSSSGVVHNISNKRSSPTPTSILANLHPRFGTPYFRTEGGICFVTRIVGPRPQWTNIAEAYSMWIGLAIASLLVTGTFYLQNKSHGIVSAFLDFERLIVGSSIMHISSNIKHRFLLGSLLFVVVVIDGAVKGRFTSMLTVVRQYPNLNTLQELKEQNVKLYGRKAFQDIFTDPQIVAEYNSKLSDLECLESIERGERKRACLSSCKSLPYVTGNLSHIHTSSTPIVSHHVWFMSTLHTAYIDRYYDENQRMKEGGIVDKFQQDLYRNAEIGSWKSKREGHPPEASPIDLDDLLPAVMLLCIGLTAASITFLWEIIGDYKTIQTSKSR